MVFSATFFSIQVKFAQDLGTSFSAASRLVLYLGITAVVGRFAGGFLCSIKQLKNLYILQGAGLINGISMMLLTLAQSYSPLVAYAFTFGFCDGVTATVMNIEAVTCVDHYRAASSFGHFLLTISVTTLVGPPISGKAYSTLATTFFSDARQPEVMLLSWLLKCLDATEFLFLTVFTFIERICPYYYMRNFCNLIGLEQWYFSLI